MSACGVVPVAAIVPVLLAGTYGHYGGTTAVSNLWRKSVLVTNAGDWVITKNDWGVFHQMVFTTSYYSDTCSGAQQALMSVARSASTAALVLFEYVTVQAAKYRWCNRHFSFAAQLL